MLLLRLVRLSLLLLVLLTATTTEDGAVKTDHDQTALRAGWLDQSALGGVVVVGVCVMFAPHAHHRCQ